MDQKNLTPDQAWQQIVELNKEREDNPSSLKVIRKAEKEISDFLTTVAECPNAEQIYLFVLKQGEILSDENLDKISFLVKDQPYAKKIWRAIIGHPEFRGFDEPIQAAMLVDTVLLEEYWKQGNDLWDEAEVALFNLPNKKQLLKQYFSYGHGLCAAAQKKLLQLPTSEMKQLLVEYFNSINKKNYWQRTLCQPGLFCILKDRALFDLYAEKMAPYYQDKKHVFPQTIAFVAQRKGWL